MDEEDREDQVLAEHQSLARLCEDLSPTRPAHELPSTFLYGGWGLGAHAAAGLGYAYQRRVRA